MSSSIVNSLFTGKRILFAPLDWGLGHATRSVSLIRELQKNNTVLLGVTPLTKRVFDEEFPELKQVEVPSYNIRYSRYLPLWIKLGLQYPQISQVIAKENTALQNILSDHKINVVISDNRFGFQSEKAHSVFITHQLFLKAPVFSSLAHSVNKKYIERFDEVWVPDFENETESLSGELSHGTHYHKNIKYIGPQSRLKDLDVNAGKKKFDTLILLSGPEPQRTVLENTLIKHFNRTNKQIALVRGYTQDSELRNQNSEISVFDFPGKKKLKELMLSSEKIICRSGYSTLMDMYLLGKKELCLIPTPGQTEQEYLANYWQEKFGTKIFSQNNSRLSDLI
jgi:spore coat polysaccharide biosynthesis predicted glycosyltransferase SpsG